MKTKKYNPEARFQSIDDACRTTGLSRNYLRNGCKSGEVPHIRSGRLYMVDVVALYKKLENGYKEETNE
jgi:hypothetical protein